MTVTSREIASAAGAAWRVLSADLKRQYEARGDAEKVGAVLCGGGAACAAGMSKSLAARCAPASSTGPWPCVHCAPVVCPALHPCCKTLTQLVPRDLCPSPPPPVPTSQAKYAAAKKAQARHTESQLSDGASPLEQEGSQPAVEAAGEAAALAAGAAALAAAAAPAAAAGGGDGEGGSGNAGGSKVAHAAEGQEPSLVAAAVAAAAVAAAAAEDGEEEALVGAAKTALQAPAAAGQPHKEQAALPAAPPAAGAAAASAGPMPPLFMGAAAIRRTPAAGSSTMLSALASAPEGAPLLLPMPEPAAAGPAGSGSGVTGFSAFVQECRAAFQASRA